MSAPFTLDLINPSLLSFLRTLTLGNPSSSFPSLAKKKEKKKRIPVKKMNRFHKLQHVSLFMILKKEKMIILSFQYKRT